MAGELLVMARLERDHQRDAGQDTAVLDRLIRGLEPIAEQSRELETIVEIRHVTERHGPGPYPPEDLAAFLGVEVAEVQRALDEMGRAGLAAHGDTPPDVSCP
jgi:hypothetical protein